MALSVNDVTRLHGLEGLKLISGEKGLDRPVYSAGIADYEFVRDVGYDNEIPFEKDSFVITSLLFAKQDPDLILGAVEELYKLGTAALAFKNVIYDKLPEEVIAFSNENNYPIFSFGSESYFENIIFSIMEAVANDDKQLLSDMAIKGMIEKNIPTEEVERIAKSVSLIFKNYVMAAYIKAKPNEERADVGRLLRSFYMNKELKSKAMLASYNDGLIVLLTNNAKERDKFEVILNEVIDVLYIDRSKYFITKSNPHNPFSELDYALRESYYAYVASEIDRGEYEYFDDIGIFKYLIPLKDNYVLNQFSDKFLKPFIRKPEFRKTAISFVNNHGDVGATSIELDCHPNTIRYRISKIKELTCGEAESDFDYYNELATAIKLYLIKSKF